MRKMPEEQLALLHDCERRGFRVIDARNYFEQMDARRPRICQIIQTPFFYGVCPVVGLTSTSRKDLNRDAKGYLNTGMVDMFVVHSNEKSCTTIDGFEEAVKLRKLVSLADADPTATNVLTTEGGKKVSQRDAYGEVQRFASTCAEFSHMKVLNEYMEESMLISGMLGSEKPTPDLYWKDYVPNVIDNLVAAEKGRISPITGERFRLMGRVTTLKDARAWARQEHDPPEWKAVPVADQVMPSDFKF